VIECDEIELSFLGIRIAVDCFQAERKIGKQVIIKNERESQDVVEDRVEATRYVKKIRGSEFYGY